MKYINKAYLVVALISFLFETYIVLGNDDCEIARLYHDCAYKGDSGCFGVGEYTGNSFTSKVGNDKVSSIKVAPGYKVIVYEHGNYNGRSKEISSDDSCLGDNPDFNFNNRITSIKVISMCQLKAFHDCEYEGEAACFWEGEFNANQVAEIIGEDKISSIQVEEGYYVELYQYDNYMGNMKDFYDDDSCLSDDGINNQISSIKVIKRCEVEAFHNCDYGGESACFTVGEFKMGAVVDLIGNDKISSLKVQDGFRVEAYHNDNYGGTMKEFTADDACLNNDGIDNRISSLKVIERCELQAFHDCDYQGGMTCFSEGEYTMAEVTDMIGNDKISSLKVEKGYYVEVYQHDNFGGTKGIFYGDDSCLVDSGLNNQISSIKVIKRCEIEVFDICNYGGASACFSVGEFRMNTITTRIGNDKISSLKVQKGFLVETYHNDNFSGNMKEFRSDDTCLNDNGIDNRISSLKVIQRCELQAFHDCDYEGEAACFGEGEYSMAEVTDMIGNDKISSLKVEEGYYVELYQHDSFVGKMEDFYDDDSCLVDSGLNNQISSIKVIKRCEVEAFHDCVFGGKSACFTVGEYKMSDVSRMIGNDKISSLKVQKGFLVETYHNDNFSGNMKEFTEDDTCLNNDGIDNRISSLKVIERCELQVFHDCNYEGETACFGEGEYSMAEVTDMIGNDKISSLKVEEGYYVEVYQHDNFGGKKDIFYGDDSCLVDSGINNQISSIKIIKRCEVEAFRDCVYGGESACFTVGEYLMGDVSDMIGNDKISSLKVQKGYLVETYQHNNFAGKKRSFGIDDSCLNNDGIDNQISSMKVVKRCEVKAYDDCNFQGEMACFGEGEYSMAEITDMIGNDKISSIQVRPGYILEAYQHDNFGGNMETFTSDDFCLSDNGINNQISSIKVIKVCVVKAYEDCNYSGKMGCFTEGEYDIGEVGDLIGNDKISSVRVEEGFYMEAYLHGGFGGTKKIFPSDESCLSNVGFDNKISSVKVIRGVPEYEAGGVRGVCRGSTARWSGDPHITTFNNLKYDCQGAGEFVIVRDLDSYENFPFEIRARFVHPLENDRVTVTRGVAITIEGRDISFTTHDDRFDSTCGVKMYVDRFEQIIDPINGNTITGVAVIKQAPNNRIFIHLDNGSSITIHTRYSRERFGCIMSVGVCLPDEVINVVGLLGTPTNTSDWMTSDTPPVFLPVPTERSDRLFRTAYDYCVTNWCITDSEKTLFTYGADEEYDFEHYNHCSQPADSSLEDLFNGADEEILENCRANDGTIHDGCVIDAVEGGDGEENMEEDEFYEEMFDAAGTKTLAPTSSPTPSPTVSPTPSPTASAPVLVPTASLPTDVPTTKTVDSGIYGDPHFKTWSGLKYDYHGICDLVMLSHPNFREGLGMEIHVRAKKTKKWSYISTAVISIGKSTFEVSGKKDGNTHWLNMIEINNDAWNQNSVKISGFSISFTEITDSQREYYIDLGNKEFIHVKTWKDMVRVDIVVNRKSNTFGGGLGLMGTYPEGLMLGRDGKTIISDFDSFGQEWQVLSSESRIFHVVEGPQHPSKCELPSKAVMRRRLSQAILSREEAEIACKSVGVSEDEFDLCVFDVMAIGDKDAVGAY